MQMSVSKLMFYAQSTSAVISGRYKCVIRTRNRNLWFKHVIQKCANVRPQETTETKYNGTVEGKKYYLSISKSYTCCSYQDKSKKHGAKRPQKS